MTFVRRYKSIWYGIANKWYDQWYPTRRPNIAREDILCDSLKFFKNNKNIENKMKDYLKINSLLLIFKYILF